MLEKFKQLLFNRFERKKDFSTSDSVSLSNHVYTFDSPRPQNFSIPNSIIYNITKSPQNSEGYKKLIKTCKYFSSKIHVFPISALAYWPRKPIPILSENGELIYIQCGRAFHKGKFKGTSENIDLNVINFKLWLTNNLYISHTDILPMLISKIYRCDLKTLYLSNQKLSYKEFIILVESGTIKRLDFDNTIVEYENNEKIMHLEEIVEILPKLKELFYNCGHSMVATSINSQTAEKLIAIPHIVNLKNLRLDGIPETFEFEAFLNFLKGFLKIGGTFYFREPLSNNYKCRLQTYINDILAEGLQENPPPIIQFPGQEEKSRIDLRELYESFKNREKQENEDSKESSSSTTNFIENFIKLAWKLK